MANAKKKEKKIIHKAKWQVIAVEGWYIHPSQIRGNQCLRALCCGSSLKTFRISHKKWGRLKKYWGNGSITWKHVTCKRCLKMRHAHD